MIIDILGGCLGIVVFWMILTKPNPEAEYGNLLRYYALRRLYDDGTFEDGAGI
jgi:hypothetical protein